MPAPASLKEFIAGLLQAEMVPRPEGEDWKAMIERITIEGQIAEIDQEAYDWFLECLPPKWMNGSAFAFAEGAEPLRLFWKLRPDSRYFARQLTWGETREFCRLARIPIPS